MLYPKMTSQVIIEVLAIVNKGFLQLLIKPSSIQYIPDVGHSVHTLIRFWNITFIIVDMLCD